jgi:hypothetical protein
VKPQVRSLAGTKKKKELLPALKSFVFFLNELCAEAY